VREWLLALDTATSTIVVAVGTPEGEVTAAEAFEGRYRHSQELLPAVARLMKREGLRLDDLAGIVVGTGPGAFTGLRVGLASAKTLAHELRRPVVGIPTSEALLEAVPDVGALWLPAGTRDRVEVMRGGSPVVVREQGDSASAADPGEAIPPASGSVAAVDLDGRAPEEAAELGRRAVAGLPAALLRLGARRLAAGDVDDPELLVPRYASPPRGAPVGSGAEDVAWSRDPR
jgi:tRNA threonylcarbamoyl adenosine modification protein YeaZ